MADEKMPHNGLKSFGMWCDIARIYRRDEDHYIGYLRRKTEVGGRPRLIQTVRGVGYALREP